MNIEYFNEYLKYEQIGIKTKIKEYIQYFINSFDNYTEKELWTFEYLPQLIENSKQRDRSKMFYYSGFFPKNEINEYWNHYIRIRNELFEEIIFPVLWNGYKNKDIKSMIWLAKLEQNYVQNKKLWKIMDFKSSMEIIKECYEIDSENIEVIDIYLEKKLDWVDYSIHEWPSGILIGNDGATKEDCKYLLVELIPLINKLDRNKKYTEYIKDYENKIKEYMKK